MSSECQGHGKNAWPELVGRDGHETARIIESENPDVQATVLPVGSMVTLDFRCDRVRVWVDSYNNVNAIPRIG
ncbi:hypothetical protein SOVF_047430 [Spinacia oleracea]|nr:hypothetical protein SOVF_047430 [Spinacia oleracea]